MGKQMESLRECSFLVCLFAFVRLRGVPIWASGRKAKGAHLAQRSGGGQCLCGAVVIRLSSARVGQWLCG